MSESEMLNVEVAYALPTEQYLFALQVPLGTTAEQAIALSPLLKEQPDVVIEQIGIFSRPVPKDTPLREGDRVEIYRPLKADPRDRRRKQVETERAESN